MNGKQYIFTFDSTHHALKFEKAAKEGSVKIIIMPVPRSIAASCGLAVKFNDQYSADIVNMVREKELSYASIYELEDLGIKKEYIEIGIESL